MIAGQAGLVDHLRTRLAEHPSLSRGALVLLAVAVGLAGGYAIASWPFTLLGGLAGLLTIVAIISDPWYGLGATVLVVTLLPFGVLPFPVAGFQLTFLDASLTLTLVLWFVRAVLGPHERLHVSPVGAFVAVYIGVCIVAFANGLAYGVPAANLRLFFRSVNGVLLFFGALNCVRAAKDGERLLALLVGGAAVAGAVGIAIYQLPQETAIDVLSGLEPLGYPSGPDVLRFNAESGQLRAIGTAIDPNAFGAMLMVGGVVAVAQLLAARSWLRRLAFATALAPIVTALLLSLSRTSWVGFAAGLAFAVAVRYRRYWYAFLALAGAVGLGLLAGGEQYLERLPVLGSFVGHLMTGLRVEDLATMMRLGEYKDALRLIAAYPWLGVGYGGNAPSVDLYVGVSSLYLLLGEYAGLLGVGAFLLAALALFWYVMPPMWRAREGRLAGRMLGCLAAVFAALVAGIADHPFINISFAHLTALFWLCAGLATALRRLPDAGTGAEPSAEV